MLTLVVLAIAYVYKNLWFDFVWRATFGQVKARLRTAFSDYIDY